MIPFSKMSPLFASQLPTRHSVIIGSVVGSDGQPMRLANVEIVGPIGMNEQLPGLDPMVFNTTQADSEGRFRIVTGLTGPYFMMFAGLDHESLQVPLMIRPHESIRVKVELASSQYKIQPQSLRVLYDEDKVAGGRVAVMKMEHNGIYFATIWTKESNITYRLLGLGERNGTATLAASADGFRFQSDGCYSAVESSDRGHVEIMLDPSRIKKSSFPARIIIEDSDGVNTRFLRYFDLIKTLKKSRDEAFRQHFASGQDYSSFVFNPEKAMETIRTELSAEKSPLLRQELELDYLETIELSTRSADTATLLNLLTAVPASSPIWVYHGLLPIALASELADSARFIDAVIARSPSKDYSALLLYQLCADAEQGGNFDSAVKLFNRLVTEYHGTGPARVAEEVLRPKATISVGSLLPEFEFRSANDTTLLYTKGSFKGKFVLLDFWTTSCAPCIVEMRYLAKAYEKYRDFGFDILSVSFDKSREYVKTFEKTRIDIPWKSTYVSQSDQPDVALSLNVESFPTLILVNPEGRVIEVGNALLDRNLLRTLSDHIAHPR
jgi:thiol-disulfide isomerase/thioredoxin